MRPHPLEKNMDTPNNIGHRPALQELCDAVGAGLDAGRFYLGAASIALRLGDCPAAVEALDKGQAAFLDEGTAFLEFASVLQEGGSHE
jgi:hypothetical protein